MHRLLLLLSALLGLCSPFPISAAEVMGKTEGATMLNDALLKISQDIDRWAYTETTLTKDAKGKPKLETVVRFDPSKPYAEQYTPLKVDDQPPTESQLKKFRAKGEKRGKGIERNERLGQPSPTKKSLGELVDLDRATIISQAGDHIVFEVPLRKTENFRFPPEKFLVLARLSKERLTVDNIAVKLREPLRTKLVVKVGAAELNVDFTTIDPKYPTQMTALSGELSASVLLVNIGGHTEVRRTDFKRVKPFGDRFDVQIGTMRALDF